VIGKTRRENKRWEGKKMQVSAVDWEEIKSGGVGFPLGGQGK